MIQSYLYWVNHDYQNNHNEVNFEIRMEFKNIFSKFRKLKLNLKFLQVIILVLLIVKIKYNFESNRN